MWMGNKRREGSEMEEGKRKGKESKITNKC